MNIVVKIINAGGQTPGKLADAELHFTGGELDGFKLVGFSVWERRGGHGRSVSFPARQYSAGGERRTFALLRPVTDDGTPTRVRDLVLEAYAKHEGNSASGRSEDHEAK